VRFKEAILHPGRLTASLALSRGLPRGYLQELLVRESSKGIREKEADPQIFPGLSRQRGQFAPMVPLYPGNRRTGLREAASRKSLLEKDPL
jgi:hypothetical protein